jgi:hypothetical protein
MRILKLTQNELVEPTPCVDQDLKHLVDRSVPRAYLPGEPGILNATMLELIVLGFLILIMVI